MPKVQQFCSLALYRCVRFLLLPKSCYSLSLCPGGAVAVSEGADFEHRYQLAKVPVPEPWLAEMYFKACTGLGWS